MPSVTPWWRMTSDMQADPLSVNTLVGVPKWDNILCSMNSTTFLLIAFFREIASSHFVN
jgi:hypothetical protein